MLFFLEFQNDKINRRKERGRNYYNIPTFSETLSRFAVAIGIIILGNTNLDKVCVLLQQLCNTLYQEIQEDSHENQKRAREFFPKPEEMKDFGDSQIIVMPTRSLETAQWFITLNE